MAVKATDQVTVIDMTDIQSVTTYYLLQASTLSAPAQPTVLNPSNWSTTEPTFTSGTTNTLYTCVRTLWGDGSQFSWGTVNVSSSYEAAKAAYNIANNAQNNLDAYIRADDAGIVVGRVSGTSRAHVCSDGSFKVEGTTGNMLTKMSAEFQLTPAGEYFQKSLLNGGDSIIMRTNAEVSPGSFQDYPSVEASMHDEYTAGYTSLKDSMVKIAAANLKVWDIYNSAAAYVSMRHFCDLLSPVVLYNSTAGTNGTVTLAGNAADYERLKIYYKSDDNTYSSVDVYQPDGKRVELSINHCTGTSAAAAGPIWVKGCMVTISGTSITVGTYGNGKIDTTASSSVSIATANVIKIVRVEGVRA